MLFERYLIPDYLFSRYEEITPAFLASIGVRALLVDIDNTLAPYEMPEPNDAHHAWVRQLREADIRLALISNNHRERVERFSLPLDVPAYWHAGKPGRKTLDRAMHDLGVAVEETAILGDQLLTDAYAGKHIGLRTLIVPPIRDKRTWFVRLKRRIERPYMARYRQKHPDLEV